MANQKKNPKMLNFLESREDAISRALKLAVLATCLQNGSLNRVQ